MATFSRTYVCLDVFSHDRPAYLWNRANGAHEHTTSACRSLLD